MGKSNSQNIIPGLGIMPAVVETSNPHTRTTPKSDKPKRSASRTTYEIPEAPTLTKEELERFKKESSTSDSRSRAGSARAVAEAILTQKIKRFLDEGTPVVRAEIIAEIQQACPNTTVNGVAAAYQHARTKLGLADER